MSVGKTSYIERIDALKIVYLGGRHKRLPITYLLDALGCRHLAGTTDGYHFSSPCQPPVENEQLVRRTLVMALQTHVEIDGLRDDGFSILDGLSRNERWRECLETMEDAYNLVLLLLDFIEALSNPEPVVEKAKFLCGVESGAVCILEQWLSPLAPGAQGYTLPTSKALCPALFGSAWCELVLGPPDANWNDRGMIYTHRPPFLPGLLPAHLEAADLPLPDMVSP
jgi:hypothetical protein